MKKIKRLSVVIYGLLFMLVIGFQGCAWLHYQNQNYGRFSPDRNVLETLGRYQVKQEMNYYISGSDVYPNALLGLDKNYVLDSTLWKKVDMTPSRLKEIVTGMHERASRVNQSLFGFSLLDPQGKPVGIWYSILSATTTFKFTENNHVLVYTPDLNTYNKYEDNRGGIGTGGMGY